MKSLYSQIEPKIGSIIYTHACEGRGGIMALHNSARIR